MARGGDRISGAPVARRGPRHARRAVRPRRGDAARIHDHRACPRRAGAGVRPGRVLRSRHRHLRAVLRRNPLLSSVPGVVAVSMQDVVVDALLVAAGITALISLGGVALMSVTPDRLHYLAPVSTLGALAVAAAVIVEDSFDARGIKALIVLAVLAGLTPVLVHATA